MGVCFVVGFRLVDVAVGLALGPRASLNLDFDFDHLVGTDDPWLCDV